MVSEAASSGRYVVVFRPKPRDPGVHKIHRHEKFLNDLNTKGFIYLIDPDQLYDKSRELMSSHPPVKTLENNRLIQDALSRIL